jgi:hypothetical protein
MVSKYQFKWKYKDEVCKINFVSGLCVNTKSTKKTLTWKYDSHLHWGLLRPCFSRGNQNRKNHFVSILPATNRHPPSDLLSVPRNAEIREVHIKSSACLLNPPHGIQEYARFRVSACS